MKKYYVEYEQHLRRVDAYSMAYSSEASSSVGSPVLTKRKLGQEFANFKSSRRKTRAPKSEIDMYFEEDCVEDIENFDILAWWKAHAEKFPVLSTMARDFLAIPLSTVPSESVFSLGSRILGESRSSLTPEMLEALVCGKDWLFKEKEADDEGREKGRQPLDDLCEDQPTSTLVVPSGTAQYSHFIIFFCYLHGCSSTNKFLNNIGQSIRYKYIIWRSRCCTLVKFSARVSYALVCPVIWEPIYLTEKPLLFSNDIASWFQFV